MPRYSLLIVLILTVALLTVSCGDKGVPPDDTVILLTIATGAENVVAAGAFVEDSLMVRVVTDKGAPVPHISVAYEQVTKIDGGYFTWQSAQITNADGYARNKYYPDTRVGLDSICATASGIGKDSMVYFVVTVLPAALDTTVKYEGDNQFGTLGQPLATPCVVLLSDKYNNVIPDFRVRFVAEDGCTVSTDSTAAADTAYTRTDENGLASATWIMADSMPLSFSVLWAESLVNDSVAGAISFGASVIPIP